MQHNKHNTLNHNYFSSAFLKPSGVKLSLGHPETMNEWVKQAPEYRPNATLLDQLAFGWQSYVLLLDHRTSLLYSRKLKTHNSTMYLGSWNISPEVAVSAAHFHSRMTADLHQFPPVLSLPPPPQKAAALCTTNFTYHVKSDINGLVQERRTGCPQTFQNKIPWYFHDFSRAFQENSRMLNM